MRFASPPGAPALTAAATASQVLESGVVDFLTNTYSTWSTGGGAAKLDVPALFDEVRNLAATSEGGMFQVRVPSTAHAPPPPRGAPSVNVNRSRAVNVNVSTHTPLLPRLAGGL